MYIYMCPLYIFYITMRKASVNTKPTGNISTEYSTRCQVPWPPHCVVEPGPRVVRNTVGE